jgi:epoxyqueuosine reductase
MIRLQALKSYAQSLGFNRIGVIPARPSPHLEAYLAWIAAGHHGNLGYLARPDRVARRLDLNVILPGVQTLIIAAFDYGTPPYPTELLNDPLRGRISSYAYGVDYHDLMTPRLTRLAEWVRAQTPDPVAYKVYVDTGAILERSHAQQAGLGFIGKNTMLIHPRAGSNFFIGEILTDFPLMEHTSAHRETQCGTCTRCLSACPTSAFPTPYTLDARRCISNLTIEQKGVVALELRSLLGNWVYGCDVCQEVCPWNRFAVHTIESGFYPLSVDRVAPPLLTLLTLTDSTFKALFKESAVARIGRERLIRNACYAAGNSADPRFIPVLESLIEGENALIQNAASWAIDRITS